MGPRSQHRVGALCKWYVTHTHAAYSRSDWLLAYLHRATAGGVRSIAGLHPVTYDCRIENVDVTHLVPGHLAYRALTPLVLGELGFKTTADYFDEPESLANVPEREQITPVEMPPPPSKTSVFPFRHLFQPKTQSPTPSDEGQPARLPGRPTEDQPEHLRAQTEEDKPERMPESTEDQPERLPVQTEDDQRGHLLEPSMEAGQDKDAAAQVPATEANAPTPPPEPSIATGEPESGATDPPSQGIHDPDELSGAALTDPIPPRDAPASPEPSYAQYGLSSDEAARLAQEFQRASLASPRPLDGNHEAALPGADLPAWAEDNPW